MVCDIPAPKNFYIFDLMQKTHRAYRCNVTRHNSKMWTSAVRGIL